MDVCKLMSTENAYSTMKEMGKDFIRQTDPSVCFHRMWFDLQLVGTSYRLFCAVRNLSTAARLFMAPNHFSPAIELVNYSWLVGLAE